MMEKDEEKLLSRRRVDKNIFGISGFCVALHNYFKEYLCVRAAAGQDRHRVKKVCGACCQDGWNRDGRR